MNSNESNPGAYSSELITKHAPARAYTVYLWELPLEFVKKRQHLYHPMEVQGAQPLHKQKKEWSLMERNSLKRKMIRN